MKAYMKNKTMSYEDKLCEVFSEYLSFINYPQVPFPSNIKIEVFDGKKDNHGYVLGQLHRIGNTGKDFEFFIEQNMFRPDQKSILYHEFTHVLDFAILNQIENYDEFYHQFTIVSEIRASFIEYAFITGSKNLSDMSTPSSLKNYKCIFNRKPSSISVLSRQYQEYVCHSFQRNRIIFLSVLPVVLPMSQQVKEVLVLLLVSSAQGVR